VSDPVSQVFRARKLTEATLAPQKRAALV